jgi:hypothetical protein
MIKFFLRVVDVGDPNTIRRDLNQLETEANDFIKNAKVKGLTALPIIEALDEGLVVGAMINWELTPR